MSRYPLHLRKQHHAQDQANIDRATRHNTLDDKTYVTTLAGDTRKLRGIPAIGRGVTGAIPGTTPDTQR